LRDIPVYPNIIGNSLLPAFYHLLSFLKLLDESHYGAYCISQENQMEKWVERDEKYTGKIFSLLSGKVLLDNGELVTRDIVHHNGGVAIVPVLNDSVVLIRQFRISIEREIFELPAGRLEENEMPEACARRELEEEIGYKARKMSLAASYYSSVGFTDEKMYIFLAFQLQKVAAHLEPDERIKAIYVPIAELGRRLENNEFEDSKTIIGLRALLAYLQISSSEQT
jgi:ADP-ribose pyrophosphatase